MNGNVRFV